MLLPRILELPSPLAEENSGSDLPAETLVLAGKALLRSPPVPVKLSIRFDVLHPGGKT